MIEIAERHGWKFSRMCNCASPGRTYMFGRNKLVIYTEMPRFMLVRIGNNKTTGGTEDLEMTLTKFGL